MGLNRASFFLRSAKGAWACTLTADMGPGAPCGDQAYGHVCDAESTREACIRFPSGGAFSNRQHLLFCEARGRVAYAFVVTPQNCDRVLEILFGRCPFEIGSAVVLAFAVFVVGLLILGRLPVERTQHDSSYMVALASLSGLVKTYPQVAVAIFGLPQQCACANVVARDVYAYLPQVRYRVDAFVPRNSAPGRHKVKASLPETGVA